MHFLPGADDSGAPLEIVELGPIPLHEWVQLTGRSSLAFGPVAAGIVHRPKDHHVAIRAADGRLVAAVGATIATVSVEGVPPFPVVGIGGLIVRSDLRGRKLTTPLFDRLKLIVESMGPDRALLFCRHELTPLYARRGYRTLSEPVWVDHPKVAFRCRRPGCGGRCDLSTGRPAGWSCRGCRSSELAAPLAGYETQESVFATFRAPGA